MQIAYFLLKIRSKLKSKKIKTKIKISANNRLFLSRKFMSPWIQLKLVAFGKKECLQCKFIKIFLDLFVIVKKDTIIKGKPN